MRLPFAALSLAYLFNGLLRLSRIGQDDSVPLILELLSARACPAGMLVLLRLAATGSIAASGIAMSLAQTPAHPRSALLRSTLMSHASVSLFSRCQSKTLRQPLSTVRRVQPPTALHAAGLALCLRDSTRASTAQKLKPLRSVSPRAFLLDIDGTLVQTDDIYFEAFKELLAPLKIDVTDEWYRENVLGKSDAQVFSRLLPNADDALLADWGRRKDALFCKLYRKKCSG